MDTQLGTGDVGLCVCCLQETPETNQHRLISLWNDWMCSQLMLYNNICTNAEWISLSLSLSHTHTHTHTHTQTHTHTHKHTQHHSSSSLKSLSFSFLLSPAVLHSRSEEHTSQLHAH